MNLKIRFKSLGNKQVFQFIYLNSIFIYLQVQLLNELSEV